MRITTEDILDTDSGVEVEIIDYRTDNCLGSINVNLDSKGKLVITHQVCDEPLDTGKEETLKTNRACYWADQILAVQLDGETQWTIDASLVRENVAGHFRPSREDCAIPSITATADTIEEAMELVQKHINLANEELGLTREDVNEIFISSISRPSKENNNGK